MIRLLTRLFIKDHDNVQSPAVRSAYGTLCSVVGILLNLLLFAAKLAAGLLVGSLSIRADAINNLSDAGSSVISLVSFKLSSKPADRDHPFGHARLEYVASMIVSFLILLIGVELVKGSVEKLQHPVAPQFHLFTVIILSLSVLCKLWLACLNYRIGKRISSQVIRATATDALSDAASSSAVLLATALAPFLPASVSPYIDPVMGLVVAALIFWAGIRILNDTKNSILGECPDKEILQTIETVVGEYPEVLAIHDLVVHCYGPGRTLAYLHAEVDGKQDVFHSHDVVDNIERRLRTQYQIECSIHLDPIVVDDPRVNEWRERVAQLAAEIDARILIHDFRMVPGTTHTNLIFDAALPFELATTDEAFKAQLAERIAAQAPDYFAVITVDRV